MASYYPAHASGLFHQVRISFNSSNQRGQRPVRFNDPCQSADLFPFRSCTVILFVGQLFCPLRGREGCILRTIVLRERCRVSSMFANTFLNAFFEHLKLLHANRAFELRNIIKCCDDFVPTGFCQNSVQASSDIMLTFSCCSVHRVRYVPTKPVRFLVLLD